MVHPTCHGNTVLIVPPHRNCYCIITVMRIITLSGEFMHIIVNRRVIARHLCALLRWFPNQAIEDAHDVGQFK